MSRELAHTPPRFRRVSTPWIAIQEFTLPPNFDVPSHGHAPPHVLVILAGSLTELNGDSTHECRVGSIRYSPGNDEHQVRIGTDGAHVLILEAPGFPELQLVDRSYIEHTEAAGEVNALRDVLFHQPCVSPGQVEEAALALFTLARAHRRSTYVRHHEWIALVRDSFANLRATKTPLADAARLVGRNASLVSRTFRATYAVSVLHYYRRRQIDHAWMLLATTMAPISTIALECGFADQSHLTRAFSTACGMTPAQLRKRVADNAPHAKHWYEAIPLSSDHS